MHITFSIARFNYEQLNEVLPKPTALSVRDGSIQVMYHFGQKHIKGKHFMWMGLIKKTIFNVFNGEVTFSKDMIEGNGDTYTIGEFYHSYCKYKTYPKWLWSHHKKQLFPNAMKYAARLHENDLFYYETVLGMIYITNQRLRAKKGGAEHKFEVIERYARWVTAKMHERIDRGDFKKLDSETLRDIRVAAGKQGGIASTAARQTKAQQRQHEVQQLLDDGVSDVHSIAGRLGVTARTIQRDIKVLKVQP